MFKQKHRKAPIVLTKDDEDQARLGKRKSKNRIKVKDDVANESKPYAGHGGMKKLLAKIREEDGEEAVKINGHDQVKLVHKSPERPKRVSPPPKPSTAEIFSFPSDEPFRPGVPPSTTSSLRVGRAKQTRNHAPSVARPFKSRFSAAYDEDDAMDEDNDARQKERQELEDAAKKAPAFSIPPGFSFAKNVSNNILPILLVLTYPLFRHLFQLLHHLLVQRSLL
jgi:nucleoporin NUP1